MVNVARVHPLLAAETVLLEVSRRDIQTTYAVKNVSDASEGVAGVVSGFLDPAARASDACTGHALPHVTFACR